jgi:hypothetical protein
VNCLILPSGFDADENVTDIPPLILLQETWFRAFAAVLKNMLISVEQAAAQAQQAAG